MGGGGGSGAGGVALAWGLNGCPAGRVGGGRGGAGGAAQTRCVV